MLDLFNVILKIQNLPVFIQNNFLEDIDISMLPTFCDRNASTNLLETTIIKSKLISTIPDVRVMRRLITILSTRFIIVDITLPQHQ